jgi:hypothetical protein
MRSVEPEGVRLLGMPDGRTPAVALARDASPASGGGSGAARNPYCPTALLPYCPNEWS